MDRDFKGIWIRKEIWLDEKLTWMEKLFLTEIDSLDNAKECFASNAYFANFFKLSSHRCSQIINQMILKKYITAEYERKEKQIVKRILRICHQGIKETSRRYTENVNNPIDNNVKDINTKINNTYKNIKKERKEGDSEETKESSKEEVEKRNKEISLRPFLKKRFPEKVEPLLELFNRVTESEPKLVKFIEGALIKYGNNVFLKTMDNISDMVNRHTLEKFNTNYMEEAFRRSETILNEEDDMEEVRGKFKQFCVGKLGETDGVYIYNFYRKFFDPQKYHECRDLKNGRDLKFTNNINYLIGTFGKDKILKIIKKVLEEDSRGTFKYHSLQSFIIYVENYDKFKGPKKEPKSSTELPVIFPTLLRQVSNYHKGDNEIYNWEFKCTCGAIFTPNIGTPCPECHVGLQWHAMTMDENFNIIYN